ncbi:hypothetical protein HWV62_44709 [Athelia sp. TMB]|nr:hypothetical protein HWV62_44709 [Athelia sp. TMB]
MLSGSITGQNVCSPRASLRLVVLAVLAVVPKHAARARAEADEQASEPAERDPVGVAVLGGPAGVVVDVALRDAEEDHADDPHDDGDERRERGEQAHEHGARAVVARAAQAEEHREPGEPGGDGVEDEHVGERVDDARVELRVGEAEARGREGVADVRARAGVAEDAEVGCRAAVGDVEERDLLPDRRGYADLEGKKNVSGIGGGGGAQTHNDKEDARDGAEEEAGEHWKHCVIGPCDDDALPRSGGWGAATGGVTALWRFVTSEHKTSAMAQEAAPRMDAINRIRSKLTRARSQKDKDPQDRVHWLPPAAGPVLDIRAPAQPAAKALLRKRHRRSGSVPPAAEPQKGSWAARRGRRLNGSDISLPNLVDLSFREHDRPAPPRVETRSRYDDGDEDDGEDILGLFPRPPSFRGRVLPRRSSSLRTYDGSSTAVPVKPPVDRGRAPMHRTQASGSFSRPSAAAYGGPAAPAISPPRPLRGSSAHRPFPSFASSSSSLALTGSVPSRHSRYATLQPPALHPRLADTGRRPAVSASEGSRRAPARF